MSKMLFDARISFYWWGWNWKYWLRVFYQKYKIEDVLFPIQSRFALGPLDIDIWNVSIEKGGKEEHLGVK